MPKTQSDLIVLLKPLCPQRLDFMYTATKSFANNKGADETVKMCRLNCQYCLHMAKQVLS